MDTNFFTLKNPVDFYIIRHGQSEGNAGKILQGRANYSLSELGRSQSVLRGRSLKTMLETPDTQKMLPAQDKLLFFTSPLLRARETAGILAAEAGLGEPVILDGLIEMDLGIWTDKTWSEVKSEEKLWHDFRVHSWDAVPGAESSADLYNRALKVWTMLCEKAAEQEANTVVVVTHGGPIQWLIKSTINNKSWFPLFPISNCGLFKFCAEPIAERNAAYTCWEEIDSTISAAECADGCAVTAAGCAAANNPRGFPT